MKIAKVVRNVVLVRAAVGIYQTLRDGRRKLQRRNRALAVLGVASGAGLAWLLYDRLVTRPEVEGELPLPGTPARAFRRPKALPIDRPARDMPRGETH